MIIIKSKREVDTMREAGRIVALAHQAVLAHLKPGISTYQIDQIVENEIRHHGAIPSFKGYGGFPGSACTSVNEEIVHGIPSKTVTLKEGDIISVDIGAYYQGYHGDSAWTYAIGSVSEDTKHLMKETEASLFAGLKMAKAGNRLSDISHAVEEHAKKHGLGVVKNYVGHGVGKDLHEDPQIPNYGLPGRGPVLKAGMTLAIEPMLTLGSPDNKVLKDEWTSVTIDGQFAAHYEHTICITDEEPIILTRL
jgi:methionyl aminopeptidase